MDQGKLTFFTSDWHLGHEQVLIFDKRPFRDLEHMHKVLVNNYNSTVPKDSVCFFLGDMGFGNVSFLKPIIEQLNGTKVLILGNHDANVNSFYRAGFDVVTYSASLIIAGKLVTMSHCPLRGVFREDVSGMKNSNSTENWHGESRPGHKRFSLPDYGQYHLHGHIHSDNIVKKRILDRQFDVGVRANNYRPVSKSQIESWVAKHKNGSLDG